jgi:hypothetical protein
MNRYGKPSAPLLDLKQSFFQDNDMLRDELHRIAKIYGAQPRRTACKACAGSIAEVSFTKADIEYLICDRCGHLNGAHEDTDEFCAAVYTEAGAAGYSKNYAAENAAAYERRVDDIYVPKAEFLADALRQEGRDASKLRYSDFGAGSGYFVGALLKSGATNVTGCEVSESQVALASLMLKDDLVIRHDLAAITDIAENVDAHVVSMIGVLEHVQHPRELLAALARNSSVEYLFISVPLFSLCVFLEMVFPQVMPRQLAAGHTHLFCEKSIDWICREFGLRRRAEWWFGTDLVDLYRNVDVQLQKSAGCENMAGAWRALFAPAIDDMQLVLDQRHLSSEVHMLLQFEK